MDKKLSFREKLDRGSDFLRFCDTQDYAINGRKREQLKHFYETDYKTYRQQLHPNEQFISFALVVKTLFIVHHLHNRGDKIYFGSHPQNQNRPQSRQSAAPHHQGATRNGTSRSNTDDTTSENKPRRRGRDRSHRSKLAVDQHIIFNKEETDQKESRESQNHESQSGGFSQETLPGTSTEKCQYPYVKQAGNTFTCIPCSARCTSEAELERHVQGRRHRLGVLTHELRIKRNHLVSNKHDIQISYNNGSIVDDTVFFDLSERVPKETTITIKNTSTKYTRELLHCELLKRIRVFRLDDQRRVTESQTTTIIRPGATYDIKVTAEARHVGSFHAPLAFHFNKQESGKDFHIIRFIHAKCKDQVTDQLKATRKYKRPPRVTYKKNAKEIIPGVPLPRHSSDNLEKKINLKTYHIEDTMRKIINRGFKETKGLPQSEVIEMTGIRSVLEKPLEMETYKKRFSTLLFAEEIQMEVDIRKYDMENVTMTEFRDNKKLLLLQVPGLAENRPSVLKGDWLYVRINADGKLGDTEYQGFVHEIRQNEVLLGFSDSLLRQFVQNMKFNVRFVFNRLPLRLQHRACELADEESLEKVLFPKEMDRIMTDASNTVPNLRFFNQQIEKNPEQVTAVQHIVSGVSRPAPYIVFGPPGTGKTVTIVEAMKQVYRTQPNAHILACTPSNSAADLLTQRLLVHVPKQKIFRLNAMCRAWSTVPADIKDVCNYDKKTQQYFFPKKDDLASYPILVCSLVTAGRIASASFPPGHFTHVFIDEAGHAVEPECLIAIAGVLDIDSKPCGQLVLAGDPQQLGPILRSPFAIKYGLNLSLLERYMEQISIYQRKPANQDRPAEQNVIYQREPETSNLFDNRVITKLLQNYRSHEDILYLPNKKFYEGELKVCADEKMRNCLSDWEVLPKKGCPVIFHGVVGQDMREERSPSFFNAEEASEVLKYVTKLLKEKKTGYKVKPRDIGIISPYRKQVQKIRSLLQKNPEWKDITIGSVEEFQGSERLVIIVSTVRSSPEYLSLDMTFKLGFLRNPKRFNVTLTRAKALLIVIGNPQTLSLDDHWRSFIEYCNEKGCYTGAKYVPESDMLEDILQRLQAVCLDKVTDTDSSEGSAKDDDGDDDDNLEGLVEEFSQFNDQAWRADI